MADRIYPTSKPTPSPTAATKPAQLYNAANRPAYRPQPQSRRRPTSRRGCCCSCCLWTTISVFILLLLLAAAGAILYALYRPQRPNFSVFSFQIAQFNLTPSSRLTSKFNLAIAAVNPNKAIVFLYDPIAVSLTSGDADVGDGAIPAFVHGAKNSTVLRAAISTAGESVTVPAASSLRSDLKNGRSLAMKIRLETRVQVKVGGFTTKKVKIRVWCDGIKATVPTGKTSATKATTSGAKCKVDLTFRIWKWEF